MSQSELVYITIPHTQCWCYANERRVSPQNCPLSFTVEGGERAGSSDTETAQRNLMMQPENSKQLQLLYFVVLLCR